MDNEPTETRELNSAQKELTDNLCSSIEVTCTVLYSKGFFFHMNVNVLTG